MNRRSVIKVSVMSLAAIASPLAGSRESPGAWAVAGAAGMAAERSDEYAWRLFVALNWPADPLARAADRSARFGADRPVVWEAWKGANEVYLEHGADPGPWNEAGSARTALPAALRFESVSPGDFPNLKHIVGGVMVPVSEPLIGGERLTEIRMNRSVYDYIRAARLYCLDDQMERYREGRPVAFPATAQQIKAKWRPIAEQERSRYHTVEVVLPDGSKKLYGLIALHIATKDLPTWFWATFEHVDNAAAGEGWTLASRDTFACGRAAPDCNRVPPGLGLAGTVWQNYRLRGTLTGFVDAQGRPRLLGNSALETGMQSSASCVTCHARSAIGVRNDQPVRLSILASGNAAAADSGIGGSSNDSGNGTRGVAERRGFVGLPQPEWFRAEADPGHSASLLLPLDFVWSLSKAKRRASVDSGPSHASVSRALADGAAVHSGPPRASVGGAPNAAMSGFAVGLAASLAQD